MSLRNPKREELRRLESKTLDAQFKTAIQDGLNCSPFEAEAVLGVVREVYCPFMDPAAGAVPACANSVISEAPGTAGRIGIGPTTARGPLRGRAVRPAKSLKVLLGLIFGQLALFVEGCKGIG